MAPQVLKTLSKLLASMGNHIEARAAYQQVLLVGPIERWRKPRREDVGR